MIALQHSPDPSAVLPGFKPILTTVGALYVLLAVHSLVQGAPAILEPFGFPQPVLQAPLFLDFYHWLFVHMVTIGTLYIMLGQLVKGARPQRLTACVLLAFALHYTYLDVRTSVWGSGLYGHPKSLLPVSLDILVTLALATLALKPARSGLSAPRT